MDIDIDIGIDISKYVGNEDGDRMRMTWGEWGNEEEQGWESTQILRRSTDPWELSRAKGVRASLSQRLLVKDCWANQPPSLHFMTQSAYLKNFISNGQDSLSKGLNL